MRNSQKYLIAFITLILFLGSLSLENYLKNRDFHKRNMDMAAAAFEYGCLVQTQNVCAKFRNIIEAGECREEALMNCGTWASIFKKSLESMVKQ